MRLGISGIGCRERRTWGRPEASLLGGIQGARRDGSLEMLHRGCRIPLFGSWLLWREAGAVVSLWSGTEAFDSNLETNNDVRNMLISSH